MTIQARATRSPVNPEIWYPETKRDDEDWYRWGSCSAMCKSKEEAFDLARDIAIRLDDEGNVYYGPSSPVRGSEDTAPSGLPTATP